MLFTSDDDPRRLQKKAAAVPRDTAISPEQLRREAVDDAREMREHQRWREFSILLFVVPVLSAIIAAIVLAALDAWLRHA